jgi:hypothetical protein
MKKPKPLRYIAILVRDFPNWLWFTREGVTEQDGRFIGVNGWSRGGAMTDINVPEFLILGRIESSELQHG